MMQDSAREAPRERAATRPSGLRRLSLAMLATERVGETFTGLAGEAAATPTRVLAAFKAAAPALGFGARIVHAIDWLFSFTQPQDWQPGSRPVVWPSARLQQEALGLGVTQTKALNRQLVELGLIAMKDSPNGKRYGRRDQAGRLLEAYGFDLAPLAARLAEFQAVAARARDEREQLRHLRRRATIARKGLAQILETVAELGLADAAFAQLAAEAQALARALTRVELVDEMAVGVAALERRQQDARKRLESTTATRSEAAPPSVDSDPTGPENRPHYYTYKPNPYPSQDTVMASEGCRSHGNAGAQQARPGSAETARRPQDRPPRTDSGTVLRLTADELVRLAPRLRPYLRSASPSWPEIVEAADWLRHDLGVSKPLWGEACVTMGREQAALALALVSAKPAAHFTASPGGYFNGMVTRAKAGQLNLARTVWGLRQGRDPAAREAR